MFLLEPDQRLVVGEERRRRHQPVQSQKHFHQLLHYALRPHATQVNIYIFIYMEALHNLKLNSSVTCSASLCFPQLDWQTRLPARGPVCPDGRHWHRGARCRRRRRRHQKRDERGRRVVSAGFWLDGVCCARLPRVSAQLLLCLTTLTALCACSPPPPFLLPVVPTNNMVDPSFYQITAFCSRIKWIAMCGSVRSVSKDERARFLVPWRIKFLPGKSVIMLISIFLSWVRVF